MKAEHQRPRRARTLKVRVTREEYAALVELAKEAGSVSALVRRQVFGERNETLLLLGRIHAAVLLVARGVGDGSDTLSAVRVLAYLVAIERQLTGLIKEATS
jgi:hypothetical protein